MGRHETEFKVGDRVRLTEDNGSFGDKGDMGTILKIGGSDCFVKLDVERSDGNDWYVAYSGLELAPLFAVGDKVRVVESVGVADIGATAVIGPRGYWKSGFGSEFVDIIWEKHANGQMNGGYYPDCFELIPSYTSYAAAEVDNLADEYGGGKAKQQKFVAGDRVRAVDGTCLLEIGTEHVINKSNDKEVWIDIDTGYATRSLSYPHRYFVAVAPATEPLTIQAGRYYKTRDGRKVGPMEDRRQKSYGGTYIWSGALSKPYREQAYNFIFDADGKNFENTELDLIAEWPVEVAPVVAPATTAASTAKFRVGDRVVDVSRSAPSGAGKSFGVVKGVGCDNVRVVWERDGTGGEFDWPASDFELVDKPTTIADIVRKHSGTAVVMLIEDGQPKPATRPYVHASRVEATTEAERLATTMPGSEFGVYELVTRRVADVVVREVA